MLLGRASIPQVCFWYLSKSVTILTRYSLVRTQFKDSIGKEIPILDYQLQQDKVLPRIAEAYAMIFGSMKMHQIGSQVF